MIPAAFPHREAEANKLVSIRHVIVDANDNGDFQTIKEAVEFVDDEGSSTLNQWVIFVRPGAYTEDNSSGPIVLNAGVKIIGDSSDGVIISPNTVANDLFEINGTYGEIANVSITGVTSASGIKDSHNSSVTYINRVKFYNCDTCIEKSGAATLFIDGVQCLSGIGSIGIVQRLAGGSTFVNNTLVQTAPSGFKAEVGILFLSNCITSSCQNGYHADIGVGTGGFFNEACRSLNSTVAAIRMGGAGLAISMIQGGIYASFGAGNSIQQDTSGALVSVSNAMLQFDRLSLTNDANVHLDSCTHFNLATFSGEGIRHRRRAYSSSSTTSRADNIVAVTAAGLTMTVPSVSTMPSQYPVEQVYVDENGAGTSVISFPAGTSFNGTAGPTTTPIPATGGKRIYGYGTTWFEA